MSEIRWIFEERLGVKVGDITEEKVDAIVNAANSTLMGGGGVDGAIHRKGGPSILEACKIIREEQYPDGLPTGKAVSTAAGRLPCRYVIHTVGPVWKKGEAGEEELLASAYDESLSLASDLKLSSVAFPALSTGVYGYPKEEAARVAKRTIVGFLRKNELPHLVYLIFFTEQDAATFLSSV
jgi:O-acetyl-ADP-ribose deacetylase (regulator of RNase III)